VVEKGGFPADAKEALVLPKYREATLPSESDVTTCVKWMVSKGLIRQSYTFDEIVEDIWSK
jgi:NitT/TauT family transport system substrate-binding protein